MSGRVTDIDANPENPTEFYVVYAWVDCGTPITTEPLSLLFSIEKL